MWLLLSFDIPSDCGREYRKFRKELVSKGFSFIQESLCLRYVHSQEKAESVWKHIEKNLPSGKIFSLQISDREFFLASFWENGKKIQPPEKPCPWIIL